MRFIRSLLIFIGGMAFAFTLPALGQRADPVPQVSPLTQIEMQAFPDVKMETFFAPSVATMVRSGVVQGYEDGSFGPDNAVTRAQVTVMLDRYDKNVVQPMREQLAQLRGQLHLGRCGDGTVQEGEKCDDGNTADGDGCSSVCLKEKNQKCKEPGVSFPAGDGCNTCACEEDGSISCTLLACPTKDSTPPQPPVVPEESGPVSPPMPGGDRDEHGCIGSAGYSWCEAKQKCLRTWEEKCEKED